jgi:hypothetical protein
MVPFHVPSDTGSDSLTFSSGDAVRLACPDANSNLLVIPNSPLTVYEVIAFCIKGELKTALRSFSPGATFSRFFCEYGEDASMLK